MLVTVHSRIVDADLLIPRAERIQDAELNRFTPWVFEHVQVADSDCTESWPDERSDFKSFFWLLTSYYAELDEGNRSSLSNALEVSQTITLPRKNWKVTNREYHEHLMRSQGMMLRVLVETIYRNLKDTMQQAPRLYFPISKFEQRYVIGGQRYASRPDGAVIVGPQERRLPVISFAGWYEGQTWSEFLAEILSIMLGQLSKNFSANLQDQEIFVLGLFGRGFYIARGYFTRDLISRVHLNGCSDDEAIEIQFTRSYNLTVKEDWLEAMAILTGLLRYLLSGNAKVGVLEAYVNKAAN